MQKKTLLYGIPVVIVILYVGLFIARMSYVDVPEQEYKKCHLHVNDH